MATVNTRDIVRQAPKGTWGRILDLDGDVYAVAANWADAAAPVYVWSPYQGWFETPRQVASFRHSERAALAWHLRECQVRTRRVGREFPRQ